MKRLIPALLAAAASAAFIGAYANDAADGGASPDRAARAEHMKAQFEKRFAEADADHDGKLSRQEAQKMPRVAKHFDEIDTGKTGYITKEQVMAKMAEAAAERRARK